MQAFLLRIIAYMANIVAVLVSVPFHEFAHAFAAVRCGDNTPKYSGRYTLNPLAHFDPIGLILMIVVRFGWAKPVPVNPNNFRNYKSGSIIVSVAGVITNIVLAFVFCPLMILTERVAIPSGEWYTYLLYFACLIPYAMFYLNVGLFVFNLFPFYPLDGFRLYDALATRRGKVYWFLYRYGMYVLIGILLLGFIADYTGWWWIDVFGMLRDRVAWPIIRFWRLFI